MGNVKLNIDGITEAENLMKKVAQYTSKAKKQLDSVKFAKDEDYAGKLAKIIMEIDGINARIKKHSLWMEQVISKFSEAEASSANTIANVGSNNAMLGISTKSVGGVANFASVGRVVPVNDGGGGKSPSNSTSLSQAEVDYREGRTAGYSKASSSDNSSKTNTSKSSSSTSNSSSNDSPSDSSNTTPQKSPQEMAEENNSGIIGRLIKLMEKYTQIKSERTGGKTTNNTVTNTSQKLTTSNVTTNAEEKKTTTKTVAKVNINIKEVWDRVSGEFESLVEDIKKQVVKAAKEQAINSKVPTGKGETIFRNICTKNRLFILRTC